MNAATHGYTDMGEILLDRGVSVNLKDNRGALLTSVDLYRIYIYS